MTTAATTDRATVERLAAALHRCFSHFDPGDGLFADDCLFDLLPPFWRFQLQGGGETFTARPRAVAEGPAELPARHAAEAPMLRPREGGPR